MENLGHQRRGNAALTLNGTRGGEILMDALMLMW